MGSDDLHWKRKRRKESFRRKVGNKGEPKQSFLIVCEGECTEPNYFRAFKLASATIHAEGLGCNTLSLVKRTIKLRENRERSGIYYDQVWSVFDRDDNLAENFNSAIKIAERNNIKVAYSNQAFELWYLLHFNYYNTASLSRQDYIDKLSTLLGYKYKKNSRTIYHDIVGKQSDAIKNSKRLLSTYSKYDNPEKANPSTTVHLLVEELNKYV